MVEYSYMDTGVRDLEVAFLRLILPDIMTYVAKINQKGLYLLLDMIIQLKYMPEVMKPARIASSD